MRVGTMTEESSKLEKYLKMGVIAFAIFSLVLSFVVTVYMKFNK